MKPRTLALLKNIFWTVCTAALGMLCLSAANNKKNAPLKGVSIVLSGVEDNAYFMTQSDIEKAVIRIIGPLSNHKVGDISCDVLEAELARIPYIEEVDVFVSGNAQLTARITQREPVLRVISDGQDFYLDSKGVRMPVSRNHTARVHVLTGTLSSTHAQEVLELVLQLRKDRFMNAFIDQLHYVSKDQVILIPKVGSTQILFGTPDNILEKFENIQAFYQEVIAETGWDRYSVIDLRYRDQIICKKNPTS